MKHTLPLITLILALSSFHLDAKPVKAKDIDRQFLAPEMQYRPYVRWWWNGDRVEPQEIIRELQVMQDAGIGGVEISPIEYTSFDWYNENGWYISAETQNDVTINDGTVTISAESVDN